MVQQLAFGLMICYKPSSTIRPYGGMSGGAAIDSCSCIPDLRLNMREIFLALDKRGNFKILQDEFGGLCDEIVQKLDDIRGKCPPRTLSRSSSQAAEMLAAINQFKNDTEPVYNLLIWTAVIASVLVAIWEREVLLALKPSPLSPPQ